MKAAPVATGCQVVAQGRRGPQLVKEACAGFVVRRDARIAEPRAPERSRARALDGELDTPRARERRRKHDVPVIPIEPVVGHAVHEEQALGHIEAQAEGAPSQRTVEPERVMKPDRALGMAPPVRQRDNWTARARHMPRPQRYTAPMSAQDVLLTILGFVVVAAALTLYSRRQRGRTWTGVVVSKKHDTGSSDDESLSTDRYLVTFRTDAGQQVVVSLPQQEYDRYAVGDKAEKKPGSYYPTKRD